MILILSCLVLWNGIDPLVQINAFLYWTCVVHILYVQIPILVIGTKSDLSEEVRTRSHRRSSTFAEECGADEIILVLYFCCYFLVVCVTLLSNCSKYNLWWKSKDPEDLCMRDKFSFSFIFCYETKYIL